MRIARLKVSSKKTGAAASLAPMAYRITDACTLLSISKSHLYDLAAEGQLRLVKLGGRSLVPASEIARLVGADREVAE